MEKDPYRADALQFTAQATDSAFGDLLERIRDKEPSLKAAILVGAANALVRFSIRYCIPEESKSMGVIGLKSVLIPIIEEAYRRHR